MLRPRNPPSADPSSSARSTSTTTSLFLVASASSSLAFVTWKVLIRRARTLAKENEERAKLVMQGPLVNCSDEVVTSRLLQAAKHRATKWMQFQTQLSEASPMPSQVGGLSSDKRRMLKLPPDYALKPLHFDERGVREVAFYEALRIASSAPLTTTMKHGNGNSRQVTEGLDAAACALASMRLESVEGMDVCRFLRRSHNSTDESEDDELSFVDALAFWLALFIEDGKVAESHLNLTLSWERMRDEIEAMKRLVTFTPAYYGVVDNPLNDIAGPHERRSDSYLLLGDVTENFHKPCVLDLKMGNQTYEPNATEAKKEREIAKYPQQEDFGFRIVGMRVYDPSHSESDGEGFRTFDKHFGRSLSTEEGLRTAFETFFKRAVVPDAEEKLNDETRTKNMSSFDLSQLEKRWKLGKGIRSRVVSDMLHQLQLIKRWFERNHTLRFYSSSLLFVYEGDLSVGTQRATSVRMIDFGHVVREMNGGLDEGYLRGLRKVVDVFSDLVRMESERLESLREPNQLL